MVVAKNIKRRDLVLALLNREIIDAIVGESFGEIGCSFYIVDQETVVLSMDHSSLFLHILPTFDMPSMNVMIADFTFVCIKS